MSRIQERETAERWYRPRSWVLSAQLFLSVAILGCRSGASPHRAADLSAPTHAEQIEGDPRLDPVVDGTETSPYQGPWTLELALEEATHGPTPGPSLIVHASPRFGGDTPPPVVLFLHGWNGCARVLMRSGTTSCTVGEPSPEVEGWGLAERFDEAQVPALFVILQLSYLARNGNPGRLRENGHLARLLHEAWEAIGLHFQAPPMQASENIVVLAHSAGFESALAIVGDSDRALPIRTLVLFDALYRGVDPFLHWVAGAPERRLLSLYLGGGRTSSQSRRLARAGSRLLGDSRVAYDGLSHGEGWSAEDRIQSHSLIVSRGQGSHAQLPARHLPALLPVLLAEHPELSPDL